MLVRHVLVDTEDIANQVYALLQSGQDFAKVAKDFSKDTGSATTGGVYDWAPASNYVPEFKDAVLNQKIGEIGKPVKTQYGYHVIQVIGREESPSLRQPVRADGTNRVQRLADQSTRRRDQDGQ